jgi:hypothetical protein
VRVSLDILAKLTQEKPHAWRSPYLANNSFLFDVLADSGVTLDSSFAIGDLKYNLPVDTAIMPKLQHLFHRHALFEFPIAGEDGTNISARERREIQPKTLAWFENIWEYILLRNAQNESITTLLVRPTRGPGAADDNIGVKVRAVEHLIQVAKAHRILVDSLVHFGDFWRARSKVTFDASYDAFECPACGKVAIDGKRVVMQNKLPPRLRATFTAMPEGARR